MRTNLGTSARRKIGNLKYKRRLQREIKKFIKDNKKEVQIVEEKKANFFTGNAKRN